MKAPNASLSNFLSVVPLCARWSPPGLSRASCPSLPSATPYGQLEVTHPRQSGRAALGGLTDGLREGQDSRSEGEGTWSTPINLRAPRARTGSVVSSTAPSQAAVEWQRQLGHKNRVPQKPAEASCVTQLALRTCKESHRVLLFAQRVLPICQYQPEQPGARPGPRSLPQSWLLNADQRLGPTPSPCPATALFQYPCSCPPCPTPGRCLLSFGPGWIFPGGCPGSRLGQCHLCSWPVTCCRDHVCLCPHLWAGAASRLSTCPLGPHNLAQGTE